MGSFQEIHTGSGVAGKLSRTLLTDPNKIPYARMSGSHQQNSSKKLCCLILTLFIFLGISASLFLVVVQQEYFIKYGMEREQTEYGSTEKLQWDELIFTQLWGYSSCLQFRDKNFPKDVTCRYQDQASFWSIHGIWPNRKGTEGPSFCTKVKFNATQLEPIRPSLDQYWYEIDNTKEGNYFWSHEWIKHGSCAKEMDTFGTELKYFSSALDFRKKIDLYSILKDAQVVPQSAETETGYQVEQISNAITTAFGANAIPYVQCLGKKNSNTNEMGYYLLAVELCFDTNFEFIPCRQHKQLANRIKDNALPCPKNEPIQYLDATL